LIFHKKNKPRPDENNKTPEKKNPNQLNLFFLEIFLEFVEVVSTEVSIFLSSS
jgi:hypothetical protein